jgi:two-component system phosphate regulon sensor histidine kinase PhoR
MIIALLSWSSLAVLLAFVGWLYAGPLGAACAAGGVMSVCAWRALWQSYRLGRWLRKNPLTPSPRLQGVWQESADRIDRLLRLRDKQVALHEERLQHFLQAIQASPNGVILLDEQGRIEWCNDTACSHLGLDAQRDRMQHILHLVRDPAFSRYFAQTVHAQELVIEGRSPSLAKSLKLSVHLHAFGEGRRLLLTRDITELALADAMRRDFVANVSHEIRTPLTVLSGFVETMQSIPLDEKDRQHYLNLMAVQSDRMQTLVADLLTLSQLEGSPPPGTQEKNRLPEWMDQIAADAAALSALVTRQAGQEHSGGHQLVFEPCPPWVLLGSRSELHSAMSNLVSNAVRYTPPGGSVRVGWTQAGDQLVFAVTDTGPGISPEHLPRLSERFYRVDRSRSRETGGTGLGLAIAKHVVQRHGGELRIQSEVGKGSTFMLVLPISRRELLA